MASIKSKSSEKMSATIMRQLEKDSEEIGYILQEAQRSRMQISRRQKEALEAYEAEMRNIGDTTDIENEMFNPKVDHNLLRHLGTSKVTNSLENFDFGSGAFPEEEVDVQTRSPKKEAETEKRPVIEIKAKEQVSMEQKENIRKELFSFLDRCHEEENQLELEYDRLRQNEDIRAHAVGDALLTMQLQNVERIKDYLKDYQPIPFGKAWGGDPDYAEMTERLKSLLLSNAKELFHREQPTPSSTKKHKHGKK